jgi:DNA protecting protein DprA
MLLTGMNRPAEFTRGTRKGSYIPPKERHEFPLPDLLHRIGRARLEDKQLTMLREAASGRDVTIFYAGELDLLDSPTVSIVGTRDVSEDGWKRAAQLARQLSSAGVTVVSGLAKGVDTAALSATVDSGGRAVAVIGTPIDKAYPAENARLQEKIYADHLLISPFKEGERVFKSNFPARNRVMAAVSDATVIIEASDTSGTLHQAAECVRLGRWLFIAQSVLEDRSLTWPAKFLSYDKTVPLRKTADVLDKVVR